MKFLWHLWAWLYGRFNRPTMTPAPEPEPDVEEGECVWCAAPEYEPCNCLQVYGDPDEAYDRWREERLERE